MQGKERIGEKKIYGRDNQCEKLHNFDLSGKMQLKNFLVILCTVAKSVFLMVSETLKHKICSVYKQFFIFLFFCVFYFYGIFHD